MKIRNWMAVLAVGVGLGQGGPARAESEGAWAATASLGGSLTRGNSESMVVNAAASAERKRERTEARVAIDANYGEAEVTDASGAKTDEKNVENARALAASRLLLDERWFASLTGEVHTDAIADVDYRAILGPGLGRYLLKRPELDLTGEAGLAYVVEKVGGARDDFAALRLADRLEYRMSENAKLWQSAEYLPKMDDFSAYLLRAELGAQAAMNASLSLRVVAQSTHDSEPAAGKDKTDHALTAALVWKL